MTTDDRAERPTSHYVVQDQVGFLLRKANQRHRAIFQAALGRELQPTQIAVLATLATDGPTHQNQLGRLVAMDSATTTGVIDRLARRGLIVSSADPDDARLSIIGLTRAGEALLAAVAHTAADVSAETLEPLTPAEAEQFVALLRKIAG